MSTHTTTGIERAASLTSVAHIANACGVSVQAVYKWIKKGHPPADRCVEVESAVNGRVSRFDLLPPTFSVAPPRHRGSRKPPKVPD